MDIMIPSLPEAISRIINNFIEYKIVVVMVLLRFQGYHDTIFTETICRIISSFKDTKVYGARIIACYSFILLNESCRIF